MAAAAAAAFSCDQERRAEDQEKGQGPIIPIGYRFAPSDHELILEYLVQKVMGFLLPSNAVRDINFYEYNPHDLPTCDFKHGKKRNAAYYFTQTQQRSSKAEGTKRGSKGGYWKTCQEEEIYHDGEIVGFKTIFVWRQEVKGTEKKSSWVLHEFRVNPSNSILPTEALDDDNIKANIKMQRCVCVLAGRKTKTTTVVKTKSTKTKASRVREMPTKSK